MVKNSQRNEFSPVSSFYVLLKTEIKKTAGYFSSWWRDITFSLGDNSAFCSSPQQTLKKKKKKINK